MSVASPVTTSGQQVRLRFSATIVNVGGVPFELHAERSDTASGFVVWQRVYDGNGGYSDRQTSATTTFAGDGHSHWHINNLERYELIRLDNGVKVGTSAKSGFCFFDTTAYRLTLPGAPQVATYGRDGCGGQDALSLRMGLSVGWGDTYPWSLPDQYIDISGLGNGQYRLVATADAEGRFDEADETNNATWVDLSISMKGHGGRVKIMGYGPSA